MNLPSLLAGLALWISVGSGSPHPCSNVLIAAYRLARQGRVNAGYKTLEQCDQPLAGHSDGGDNGQGDKPGDEAVFDGGGAELVAQKLPKHFMLSRILTKALWHAQVAVQNKPKP